jgi:FKBP-type peptidyl-prolyl cis-trans isomerase 2
LDDGSVFDTSIGRAPLEFTIGDGQLIGGFEDAVVGMNLGESRTAKVVAEEAYGPHRQEMVIVVERAQVPKDLDLPVGQQLQLRQEGGTPFLVTVTQVTETNVTLDANHPLAGKDLTFDIQLVEIV